MGQPINPLAIH